jgi:predicted DNA-binding antitoxin AbrB/MazE fold protein
MTIPAVFSNGVFQPTQPPALDEGTPVNLTVSTVVQPTPPTEEELRARIRAAKTWKEFMTVRDGVSTENGDYDIEAWIAETRAQYGTRR